MRPSCSPQPPVANRCHRAGPSSQFRGQDTHVANDPDNWAEKLRGKFIVFDGPDGCGKSTQRELLGQHLVELGLTVVQCKDPGGTTIGDRIRHVLLDHDLSEMDVRCETFLFMASRAQLVGEVVEPALERGEVVLCDRFVSATCAYQGAAGYDPRRVVEVASFAVGQTWPDLTLVFDVDVKQGFDRTGRRPQYVGKNRKRHVTGTPTMFANVDDGKPDAMEARPMEFHRKVRANFLSLGNVYPRPVEMVDGRPSVDEVHACVVEVLNRVDL